MKEFTCVVCGKTGIDKSTSGRQKYCSKQCANRVRYSKNSENPCLYNDAVGCVAPQCDKCGWNPEVEKIRKERLFGG